MTGAIETGTFERSCAHWSEAKRSGMEDFYSIATADYRHLAEAVAWKSWLEARQAHAGDRPLRLLDVACGSGKFPVALVRHAGIKEAAIQPIDYALLDPAPFSLSEARQALTAPFVAGQEYLSTLQALECPPGAFDVVWATHALYAVPAEALDQAMARFLHALADRGRGAGFIAHGCAHGHYLHFQKLFLDAFGDPETQRYTDAEAIEASLRRLGATIETQDISYENGLPETSSPQIEGFLQRCVFDDSVSLDRMLSHDTTGPYLAGCRQDGHWRFPQTVRLIFVSL